MRYRFGTRSALILTAFFCIVFALGGLLLRTETLTSTQALYGFLVLLGSLLGTTFGALLERPERNRWLRAFVTGTAFGALAQVALFAPLRGMTTATWFYMSLFMSTIPAFAAATATELLRTIIARLK